jgi:hypothetical protein
VESWTELQKRRGREETRSDQHKAERGGRTLDDRRTCHRQSGRLFECPSAEVEEEMSWAEEDEDAIRGSGRAGREAFKIWQMMFLLTSRYKFGDQVCDIVPRNEPPRVAPPRPRFVFIRPATVSRVAGERDV